MGYPMDPVKRAAVIEKMRAAQRKRWECPERREAARQKTIAQYADPEQRRRQSEIKKRHYAERPELRAKVTVNLLRHTANRWSRHKRLMLIRQRAAMLGCTNGTTQSAQ